MSIATAAVEEPAEEVVDITWASQITLETASRIIAKHLEGNPEAILKVLKHDFRSYDSYFQHGSNPNDDHVYEYEIYQFIDQARNKLGLAPRTHLEHDPLFHAYVELDIDYEVCNRPCINIKLERDEFDQPVKLTPRTAIGVANEMIRLANIAISERPAIAELYPVNEVHDLNEHWEHHFMSLLAALEADKQGSSVV